MQRYPANVASTPLILRMIGSFEQCLVGIISKLDQPLFSVQSVSPMNIALLPGWNQKLNVTHFKSIGCTLGAGVGVDGLAAGGVAGAGVPQAPSTSALTSTIARIINARVFILILL